jgi:ADP-heptose:LPS heptosyltransferase
VRCIKKQTNAEIHFLTKTNFNEIVSSNPYIEKVWQLKSSLEELLPALKKENYDLIVDLHNNLRSRLIRWSLFTVPVVSYSKGNLAKWLSVHFKINKFSEKHIAIKYLQSVKKWNITDDGMGLDYFIPEKDKVNIESIVKNNRPFIALVIGAAHFTKRVPVEKLKEIISIVLPSYPIVLIGGKAEKETGDALVQAGVMNTCGQYSINQSASILAQSTIVISPDTGMMHIAAALKKPIRSIWGSTLSEFGFWPFYGEKYPDQNISFEVNGLVCRPCARFGRNECPQGHFDCMTKQKFDGII